MKNSLCRLAVAFGLLLTLNSARAVIDFDPAPDPEQPTPAPQPPSTPSPTPAPTLPTPSAPPVSNPPPHEAPTQPPMSFSAAVHSTDERRFVLFSKLKLSDDQKTKMEQIIASNDDIQEKRRHLMDMLTVAQKIQLRTLVDGWKGRRQGGSSSSASTQE